MSYRFNVSELSDRLRKGVELLKEDYQIDYDEKGCKRIAKERLDQALIVETQG